MTQEFEREQRYVVLKVKDVMQRLSEKDILTLARILDEIDAYRKSIGKTLECVVIESDWPEYEPTWKAIEARVTSAHPASPAPSVPDTYAAGINAVAAMLQSKADEYAKEYGHDDMGGLSFGPGMGGEIKMDYYTNLIELVDDVRAMLTAAPNVPSVPDGSAVQTSARKENDHVATYRNGT